MSRLVVAAALALVASTACEKGPPPPPPPASPWVAPANTVAGERLASCVNDTLGFVYATQKQEYGDPWKERDTFAFFDADKERLHVAFLGSADTVDGAKARLEARLPVLKQTIARCEKIAGVTVGEALTLSYSQVNRGDGSLKDVLIWQSGKFDFPKASEARPALDWLGSLK